MAVVFKSSGDMETVGILIAPSMKYKTEIIDIEISLTILESHFNRKSNLHVSEYFPDFFRLLHRTVRAATIKNDWCTSAKLCTCSTPGFSSGFRQGISLDTPTPFFILEC